MEIEKLRDYVSKNKTALSGTNRNFIEDIEERVIGNLKKLGYRLPNYINTIHELVLYLDPDGGKCDYPSCSNKKKKKTNWTLNRFCSKECSSKNFSDEQKKDNTCKRMTEESKNSMRSKISECVKNKIKNGTFNPAVTNSWCHSKINLLIKGKMIKVRSSWEAIFYLSNQNLSYEVIRIPYYDTEKEKERIYIVDFCDFENKILYEIKPSKQKINCENKESYALDWCKENKYKFVYIDEVWIFENYKENILADQPEREKIKYRIEKIFK